MTKGSVVVGLMFGDEGKGATVDFLAHSKKKELGSAPLVVKSSSACQPEHNVVTPQGVHHTFSQIGSGTFAGSSTHIASNCLFEPLSFRNELRALHSLDMGLLMPAWPKLSISPKTKVITPFHKLANNARYMELGGEYSTTGRGVWETVICYAEIKEEAILRVEDLVDVSTVEYKLNLISNFYREQGLEINDNLLRRSQPLEVREGYSYIGVLARQYAEITHYFSVKQDAEAIKDAPYIIFEQAQGVLLDADFQTMYPYVTGMNTTSDQSIALAKDLDIELERVYGCLRTYVTRHGAGIFPTEVDGVLHPEAHNSDTGRAGKFRQGYFDAVLANLALEYDKTITHLSLSHCDVSVKTARVPEAGDPDGRVIFMDPTDPKNIEFWLGRPVGILGSGPTTADREFANV